MVAPGETLSSIAARYGVAAARIAAANRLPGAGVLVVGQPLLISRLAGVVHVVAPGESVLSISRLYGVTAETITETNALADPGFLIVGQLLFIPGGGPGAVPGGVPSAPPAGPTAGAPARLPTGPSPSPTAAPSGGAITSSVVRGALSAENRAAPMVWPLRQPLSQSFGEEGHTGIDIMADTGDPITAAAAGMVTLTRDSDFGYGWRVEIDHGSGITTLYAHLSSFSVKAGDRVTPGQRIGAAGSTGASTGPHLHFEVRRAGVPVDPLPYLP